MKGKSTVPAVAAAETAKRQTGEASRSDSSADHEEQLRRFLELLFGDRGLREVRVLDAKRTNFPHKTAHTEHGYFRPEDADALLNVAAHYRSDPDSKVIPGDLGLLSGRPKGVYYTLNPVKEGAFARSPAVMGPSNTGAASDADIDRRTRLLIDIDAPREVSKVAASDSEKSEARALTDEVLELLYACGWPAPIEIDSGNGYQLIYAVDLPTDAGGLVQQVLQALAALFPRADGGIDTSVHNPARIARLPSTWNCKGHDVDDRPHRLAQVLSLPEALEPVSEEQLSEVAARASDDSSSNRKQSTRSSTRARPTGEFKEAVDRWNADHPFDDPQHRGECPICGSPDGFKSGHADTGRWVCFSSRHTELTGDKNSGRGCPGNACFTGDALDIEAWTSNRTRKLVLQDDNYLQVRRDRAGTAAAADLASTDLVALGERDPETGRVVLSSRRTLPTAQAFLNENYSHTNLYTLVGYADKLWRWTGNRYEQVEDEAIRSQLFPWLHDALRYIRDPETKQPRLVDFESNPGAVKNALATIHAEAFLPASVNVPFWRGDGDPPAPLQELLPCQSNTLHIPSRRVLPATPELFAINALEFDYDPAAPAPIRWLAFLEQLFGDDAEAVELLQEWMGYCLTCDTSQQKVLLLVGPRRSGKGTIARVLRQLVGEGNVVGPTVSSLATQFGAQQLLGKANAIVSDARFAGDRMTAVAELLLCISGEDAISVDRKFQDAVSLRLPVRFTFLANELPALRDASSALAGRFLVLRLTRSFYGEENTRLTDELLTELPGILIWALEGLDQLRERGRFVQPTSSRQDMQDLEDLSSPVIAFVRETCVQAPGLRVNCRDLYRAWVSWCKHRGGGEPCAQTAFGKDLKTAMGLQRRRHASGEGFYDGIGLRSPEEGR